MNAMKFGTLHILMLGLIVACSPAGEQSAVAQRLTETVAVVQSVTTAQVPKGTITGTVKFEGDAPPMRPLPVESDPHCVRIRGDKPLLNEMLVLGEGQTMANVLVRVVSNLPAIEHPVPSEPVILSQVGCQYTPHVLAVRKGQSIEFHNEDGINHNVHLMPEKNKEMNRAMANAEITFTYETKFAEDVFTIKCDVHSWMKAYCAVLDHPYFAVTGTDGAFTIEGLPPGTYDVEVWHEVLKTQTASVTITDEGGASIDFTYTPPQRKK